jgi:hypothetical protein
MGLTMCMARPKLICPNCKKQVAVTRPDSAHTYWSFEKPNENDVKTDIIEQNFECNNLIAKINSNFTGLTKNSSLTDYNSPQKTPFFLKLVLTQKTNRATSITSRQYHQALLVN